MKNLRISLLAALIAFAMMGCKPPKHVVTLIIDSTASNDAGRKAYLEQVAQTIEKPAYVPDGTTVIVVSMGPEPTIVHEGIVDGKKDREDIGNKIRSIPSSAVGSGTDVVGALRVACEAAERWHGGANTRFIAITDMINDPPTHSKTKFDNPSEFEFPRSLRGGRLVIFGLPVMRIQPMKKALEPQFGDRLTLYNNAVKYTPDLALERNHRL